MFEINTSGCSFRYRIWKGCRKYEEHGQKIQKTVRNKNVYGQLQVLNSILLFQVASFSHLRIQNFLADSQIVWCNFQKLVSVDKIDCLLQT